MCCHMDTATCAPAPIRMQFDAINKSMEPKTIEVEGEPNCRRRMKTHEARIAAQQMKNQSLRHMIRCSMGTGCRYAGLSHACSQMHTSHSSRSLLPRLPVALVSVLSWHCLAGTGSRWEPGVPSSAAPFLLSAQPHRTSLPLPKYTYLMPGQPGALDCGEGTHSSGSCSRSDLQTASSKGVLTPRWTPKQVYYYCNFAIRHTSCTRSIRFTSPTFIAPCHASCGKLAISLPN
jgi:hypothetical protein